MADADDFGASPLGRSKRRDSSAQTASTQQPRALEFTEPMDDVLYGDLDPSQPSTTQQSTHATTMLKLKASKLQSELAASEETVRALQEELRRLQTANEELREKNGNLEYNISSLFNTAKLEIERKDKEIQRLRRESANQVYSRGGGVHSQRMNQGDGRRRSSSVGGGGEDRQGRR